MIPHAEDVVGLVREATTTAWEGALVARHTAPRIMRHGVVVGQIVGGASRVHALGAAPSVDVSELVAFEVVTRPTGV